MVTNKQIGASFKLLGQLMEVYNEDKFKIRSYLSVSRTIEKLSVEISTLPEEDIFRIPGVGNAIGHKIIEQLQSGTFAVLQKYLDKTPDGIIQMLQIKGLGPKKVAIIWNELQIETVGELLYACNENRLMLYKGFGEKTQENIRQAIEFYLSNQGRFLWAEIETCAEILDKQFKRDLKQYSFLITGDFYRNNVIVDTLEWVTDAPVSSLRQLAGSSDFSITKETEGNIWIKSTANVSVHFISTEKKALINESFKRSCAPKFYDAFLKKNPATGKKSYASEAQIFLENKLQFIPPYLREEAQWIGLAEKNEIPHTIQTKDIKGIIHAHSKWSDGANTLQQMAEAAKEQGFEYLVISDHSQTAVYAHGLEPDRVLAQHSEIDELNEKLTPFKIFKGIESDILSDGSLDYTNNILAQFDIVIASIHSNLKMDETRAMTRLINAIENPYTRILGHPTGRLLLSREGYPVNHKKLIDACAANQVVIELNANPRRLDIDWKWINYAQNKNVLISIDPDAHSIKGMNDIRYGVLAAQKAGMTIEQNLSSYPLAEMDKFIQRTS